VLGFNKNPLLKGSAKMNQQLPQVPTKLLINGKWLEGTKESVSVTNPATNEELVKVSQEGSRKPSKQSMPQRLLFPNGQNAPLENVPI